jgi:hypothetical protein
MAKSTPKPAADDTAAADEAPTEPQPLNAVAGAPLVTDELAAHVPHAEPLPEVIDGPDAPQDPDAGTWLVISPEQRDSDGLDLSGHIPGVEVLRRGQKLRVSKADGETLLALRDGFGLPYVEEAPEEDDPADA